MPAEKVSHLFCSWKTRELGPLREPGEPPWPHVLCTGRERPVQGQAAPTTRSPSTGARGEAMQLASALKLKGLAHQ